MMRTPALATLAAAAAALLLALAGCHGGATPSSSTGSTKAGSTASAAPEPTATVSAPPSVAVPNPGPAEHPLPPATAVDEASFEMQSFGAAGPAFDSPSRNLHCAILDFGSGNGGYWGCQAETHSWAFASASPGDPCYNSEVNCGQGIEGQLDGDPAVLKAGDLQFPGTDPSDYSVKVLTYGTSVSYAGITCASEEDGVTCIRAASGHGFQISKTLNTIF